MRVTEPSLPVFVTIDIFLPTRSDVSFDTFVTCSPTVRGDKWQVLPSIVSSPWRGGLENVYTPSFFTLVIISQGEELLYTYSPNKTPTRMISQGDSSDR